MQAEIYMAPELTVVETETLDVICTSGGNEGIFEENGDW